MGEKNMKNKTFLMISLVFVLICAAVVYAAPKYSCIDSDGQNSFTKGVVTFSTGIGSAKQYSDLCVKEYNNPKTKQKWNMYEYYCTKSTYGFVVATNYVFCENGCANGVCKAFDLMVDSVNVTKTGGRDEIGREEVIVKAVVKNIGNAPSKNFDVEEYIDGVWSGAGRGYPSLAPGETVGPSNVGSGSYFAPGKHTFKFNIVANGTDKGLSNNQKQAIFEVEKTKCVEDDGGKNYEVKGATRGTFRGGEGDVDDGVYTLGPLEDMCDPSGNGYLNEYYCDADGYSTYTYHECLGGCANGACIASQAPVEYSEIKLSGGSTQYNLEFKDPKGRAISLPLVYKAPGATALAWGDSVNVLILKPNEKISKNNMFILTEDVQDTGSSTEILTYASSTYDPAAGTLEVSLDGLSGKTYVAVLASNSSKYSGSLVIDGVTYTLETVGAVANGCDLKIKRNDGIAIHYGLIAKGGIQIWLMGSAGGQPEYVTFYLADKELQMVDGKRSPAPQNISFSFVKPASSDTYVKMARRSPAASLWLQNAGEATKYRFINEYGIESMFETPNGASQTATLNVPAKQLIPSLTLVINGALQSDEDALIPMKREGDTIEISEQMDVELSEKDSSKLEATTVFGDYSESEEYLLGIAKYSQSLNIDGGRILFAKNTASNSGAKGVGVYAYFANKENLLQYTADFGDKPLSSAVSGSSLPGLIGRKLRLMNRDWYIFDATIPNKGNSVLLSLVLGAGAKIGSGEPWTFSVGDYEHEVSVVSISRSSAIIMVDGKRELVTPGTIRSTMGVLVGISEIFYDAKVQNNSLVRLVIGSDMLVVRDDNFLDTSASHVLKINTNNPVLDSQGIIQASKVGNVVKINKVILRLVADRAYYLDGDGFRVLNAVIYNKYLQQAMNALGVYIHYDGLKPLSSPCCIDSDKGINYYMKGSTKATEDHSGGEPGTDYCTLWSSGSIASCSGDDCYVTEHYCEDGNPFNLIAMCPGGCSDGACQPTTMQFDGNCNDPDGMNYSVKGITYFKDPFGGIVGTSDSCCNSCLTAPSHEGQYVSEMYCENGGLKRVTGASCPTGQWCVDGACVKRSCSDSDGGKNYYVKGNVSMAKFGPSSPATPWTDKCLKDYNRYIDGEYQPESGITAANGLLEASCGPNLDEPGVIAVYECPNGCSNGACVNLTVTQACTDSDGGKNYYVKGSVSGPAPETGLFGTSEDYCRSEEYLDEAHCSYSEHLGKNARMVDVHYCPTGCSNGACISAPNGGGNTTGNQTAH